MHASVFDGFPVSFPEKEAEYVFNTYDESTVILEYGSGGSTLFSGLLQNKLVFSVDSDAEFLCNLNTRLMQLRTSSRVITMYCNIGHVKKWGKPADEVGWRGYSEYARGVWGKEFFVQPDTVLIDGRFRVSCFVACAVLTKKPLRVLFDDYLGRPHYHVVERVAKPEYVVGRLASFLLIPDQIKRTQIIDMIPFFYDER